MAYVVVGLVLLVVVIALAVRIRVVARERKEDLAAWARDLGGRYLDQDPGALGELELVIFRIPETHGQTPAPDAVTSHIAGAWDGIDFDVAKYAHRIDPDTIASFTLAVAHRRERRPRLLVSADPLVEEVGRRLQLEDTHLGSERLVTGATVLSEDPDFASRVVDEDLGEWLRAHVRRFSFEVDKGTVAAYARAGDVVEFRPPKDAFKATIDVLKEFCERLDGRG